MTSDWQISDGCSSIGKILGISVCGPPAPDGHRPSCGYLLSLNVENHVGVEAPRSVVDEEVAIMVPGLSPFFWEFGRTGEAGLSEDRDVGAPLVGARGRTLLIGPGRATTHTRIASTIIPRIEEGTHMGRPGEQFLDRRGLPYEQFFAHLHNIIGSQSFGMTVLSRITARLSALRAASGVGRRSMAASCW